MPTNELLKSNNTLSIHQMGTVGILTTYRKILETKKPDQIYKQLSMNDGRHGTTWSIQESTPKLSIT